MVDLAGYEIAEQIYAGSRTAVYRAWRQIDRQRVVIKQLNNPYPTFSELLQFRNQYTIAKNLNIPGIVRPYSLESSGNSYALVMEDCGGIALNRLPSQFKPLTIEDILSIGIQLADILHELHQNRVIHKDIKPANILINSASKQVKLIDFSIASLLPKENQEIANPNILEGTLAYISPEQTGRMNRGIDYRSDFYSFGVTLFELLAGQLPFTPIEPMELLHCHIAKIPPRLDEFTDRDSHIKIPAILAEIVMKLMAKNAENRYQSALGLKHDLEKCLVKIKETGTIKNFEIAQRDASDRFLISEKLYGRTSEVKTLLDAFDRVSGSYEFSVLNSELEQPIQNSKLKRGGHGDTAPTNSRSELMLVAGFSGIGKTAVVNEVHKPIVRQRGYFIKGKFDQFNRNIPLSAFVQALRDLMQQLLSESDAKLAGWKARILSAVGENGQVLIDVIPELEQIIGKQPTAPELSGAAALNRFNLLLQKFLEVFTTAEHPLVLFLDDLQWADLASLQLLKLLVNDRGYLLVLGAYRDNEVSPAHPFILTVEELKKAGTIVNTITLAPLAFEDTNHLIADTLNCSRELAQPLTELVARKTRGNPFFTTQFLKALYEDGCIRFDRDRGYWECDIAEINALSLTDDVVEFMAWQLQKLPAATQQVLKLAACVGDRFDLATLAIVSEQLPTDAATALWKALQEGLILPTSQVYKFFHGTEQFKAENTVNPTYRFLHDRVQQAAYSLIPEDRKQATHYKIGQLLQQSYSELEQEQRLFDIVEHLNLAIELISQPKAREALAQLNLKAGQKARNATAYAAARAYIQTGIGLLTDTCWQNQYELTFNLYVAAAETAYLNTDFELAETLSEEILHHVSNLLDRVRIYELKVQMYTAQNQLQLAVDTGLKVLDLLQVPLADAFPSGLSIHDLYHLPAMVEQEKLIALKLLIAIAAPAYNTNPALVPRLTLTMIHLCVNHGNSSMAAYAYAFYGMLLCATLADIELGYEFGKLALWLLGQFESRDFKGKVYHLFNVGIRPWKEPAKATLASWKNTIQWNLEAGDIGYACYAAMGYCIDLFLVGESLEVVQEKQYPYIHLIEQFKQEFPLYGTTVWAQLGLNLRCDICDRTQLTGELFNEALAVPILQATNNLQTLFALYLAKTMLHYCFNEYEQAAENVTLAVKHEKAMSGLVASAQLPFYQSLVDLALYPTVDAIEQHHYLEKIAANQQKMKLWADHAPANFQHKCDLIAAQKCRVLGKNYEAGDWYDRAITGAKENQYIQEAALANELAAKFYLDWGKEKIAAGYMQEAYYCYAKWGAKAKTDDLEKRYPDLLQPILRQAAPTLNPWETLASLATPNLSLHNSTQNTRSSSSSSINTALDFAAILKASQAISSTIYFDELLRQLTQIILQNSGADCCAFILPDREQKWSVKAIATPEMTELCTQPLEGNPNIPVKLIQYVKNTQEVVVIDDLKTDLPVICEYLLQQQPQSILCLPLLDRGHLAGILYLQNRCTSGVFASDRILIINFLCTQAAISLENARLYQQAQDYSQQLEQSQLQIVQSEKMASLGNLVAGVAHEINNPIGFINGSINNTKDYVQDLLEHLALYQQHYPHPVAPIQENAADIDLEFTIEDLPNLVDAMQNATDRIKNISTSLRTFSRADTDCKISANLLDGLDSTLLILKYRLKANDKRPAIEVIKNYGDLPEIECFPGQLNQVFMNIVANAIDMFDELTASFSFKYFEANPQQITIQTERVDSQAFIRIRDNGKGISKEVQPKIFDHLFTTKPVGKGTGLGLAIARQIIVEKHGGAIEVNSTLGKGTEFAIFLPLSSEQLK